MTIDEIINLINGSLMEGDSEIVNEKMRAIFGKNKSVSSEEFAKHFEGIITKD